MKQFIDELPPDSVEFAPKYFVSRDGSVYSARHNRLIRLRPRPNGKGYYHVMVGAREMYIHRLVALAFIPNPDGLKQVNHIDGVKSHNNASNLEWVSQSQNLKHAYSMGLISHEHLVEIARLGGIRKAQKYRKAG